MYCLLCCIPALIAKTVIFEFVNNYAPLLYIAFIKPFAELPLKKYVLNLEHASISALVVDDGDVMAELAVQLFSILFVKSIANKLVGVVKYFVSETWSRIKKRGGLCKNKNKKVEDDEDVAWFEDEAEDPTAASSASEYQELVIMYGYLVLFASAFPLAPLICLITR